MTIPVIIFFIFILIISIGSSVFTGIYFFDKGYAIGSRTVKSGNKISNKKGIPINPIKIPSVE
jgi:hypothetical protein